MFSPPIVRALSAKTFRRIGPIPMLALLSCLLATGQVVSQPARFSSDENWDTRFFAPDAPPILAVAHDAHGALYVGGDFSVFPGTDARRIAKWNGAR